MTPKKVKTIADKIQKRIIIHKLGIEEARLKALREDQQLLESEKEKMQEDPQILLQKKAKKKGKEIDPEHIKRRNKRREKAEKKTRLEKGKDKVKEEMNESEMDNTDRISAKGNTASKEQEAPVSPEMNSNPSIVSSHLMFFKSLENKTAKRPSARLAPHVNDISSNQVNALRKKFENSEDTSQTVKRTEINTESNSPSVRERVRQLNQQTTDDSSNEDETTSSPGPKHGS